MMSRSLNNAVISVLQQGCIFLDRVDDETYARPLEGTDDGKSASPLGAHYRHVLDHFLCLAEGIRTGQVNYDQRRRNPQLENSVTRARLATEALIDELGGLSPEILQRDCAVIYSVGYGETDAEAAKSNLAREVDVLCRPRHPSLRHSTIFVHRRRSESALRVRHCSFNLETSGS